MNTRIVLTSLSCLVLLALPAHAAIRPEIARDLRMARFYSNGGLAVPAIQQIKAAEALPDQTAEEQHAVAATRAAIGAARQNSLGVDRDFNVFPSPQAVLPPNYSPNPPSQVPNEPHPY